MPAPFYWINSSGLGKALTVLTCSLVSCFSTACMMGVPEKCCDSHFFSWKFIKAERDGEFRIF